MDGVTPLGVEGPGRKNFAVFCVIIVEVFPRLLRDYFKAKWNEKYPDRTWDVLGDKAGDRFM